jgi:hypothetical protein
MKRLLAGATVAFALMGAGWAATGPAEAAVHFGITINAGDVAFAYRDGYWDRFHRWHAWRDPDDWRWYQMHYREHYYDWAHDRDRDLGWRPVGGPGFVVGVPAFEVGVGDIAFAYRDGYWDRWHRWHAWRGEEQRVWWREHHPAMYWDWRHDRDRDMGWRRY